MGSISKYFPAIKVGVAVPLLSGCSGPGGVDEKPEYTITGTVRAPNSLQVLMQEKSLLASMLSSVFPESKAAVTGDMPVANAKVELVSMYNNGYEESYYIEPNITRTNAAGEFIISTTEPLSSNLMLRVEGRNGGWMHALVVGEHTDIDMVSEYVYSSVLETVYSGADIFLPYFSAIEIENLLASIEMLDVNLSGVSSIYAATDLISAADAGVLANDVAAASSPNLEGVWLYVKKSGPNSCGNPVGVNLIDTQLVVSQDNDALTIYIDGNVFSTGTLFGRSVVGLRLETYQENGGTMAQTSSTMTVASDNKTVDGTILWDWFGGTETCSGSDTVSVTRK